MSTATDDVRVTFNQDVWWRTREGLHLLIDDMDEQHRANTAAMLLRNAERHYLVARARKIWGEWISYVGAAEEAFWRGSWGPADPNEAPTAASLHAEIQPEIDAGKHVEWMQSTPLYRRLIA